jgi:hypothetical protein
LQSYDCYKLDVGGNNVYLWEKLQLIATGVAKENKTEVFKLTTK